MKKLVYLILLVSSTGFAQYYKTYDWKSNPKLHELTSAELSEASVGILKKNIVEYQKSLFGSGLNRFETQHTIVRVNNDYGINRHNTVYIPMYEVKQVVDIKARTIHPDGKVTLLNKDNIKEVKNVEEYGDFKIFAIEGAEEGSEIEVLYTVEKQYDMHGTETIQSDFPIKEARFLFITDGLNANIKAYRTDKSFETVDVNGKPSKQIVLKDIPAMLREEYATPDANKITVAYQCFPEGQNVTHEMFWENVVSNIGSQFFAGEIKQKVIDDIKGFVKDDKELTTFKVASMVDNFIKTNFIIIKNNNAELSDLDYILENRSASEFGIIKAYAQYLSALNIDYEFVITANRYEYKFDPEFFTPGMLRNFIIYLPSEEKYISPSRIEYRVGEVPSNILGNYGLYMNKNFEYYFSKIVQSDPNFSRTKRITNITFDEDIESATLDQNHEYYGHWAITNRAILNLSPKESIKQFEDFLTSSGIEDKVIESFETENTDMNPVEYNPPFVVKAKVTSESLLEEAGDSYIFQIGKVIGTQSELYQEHERMNPIEMDFPNQYDYTITIHIPEGYEVDGLDALKIYKSYTAPSGEKVCKFESDYTLEGDKLVITIQEFYRTNEYDISSYEQFRTVINAASDFNKASILLNPLD